MLWPFALLLWMPRDQTLVALLTLLVRVDVHPHTSCPFEAPSDRAVAVEREFVQLSNPTWRKWMEKNMSSLIFMMHTWRSKVWNDYENHHCHLKGGCTTVEQFQQQVWSSDFLYHSTAERDHLRPETRTVFKWSHKHCYNIKIAITIQDLLPVTGWLLWQQSSPPPVAIETRHGSPPPRMSCCQPQGSWSLHLHLPSSDTAGPSDT